MKNNTPPLSPLLAGIVFFAALASPLAGATLAPGEMNATDASLVSQVTLAPGETFKVLAMGTDGVVRELKPSVTETGDTVTITVPKSLLCKPRNQSVHIVSAFTTARAGDKGYMFFPTNFGCGFVTCHFDKKGRKESQFSTWMNAPAVAGLCGNENAVFVRVAGGRHDARFSVEFAKGVYSITPEFVLDGDEPDEDLSVVYKKMPGATYSDMARAYRKYQLEEGGCVPLKERAAQNEILKRAADRLEIRVRMGWKPLPTPVRAQTLENEPPMKIACDIAELNKIVDELKAQGVEKAEICLVGWGPGGHDGRFPQQYPSDERFGGDKALKAFIARAQKMGYMVVCHTVSCGAYQIADNWDRDLLTKKINPLTGEPEPYLREQYKKHGLNGGDPWHLCAKAAYENYAVKDLPVVRGYGFSGLHYVDELTATIPEKCYDKNHPVSRKQAREYYQKIARLSKKLFGGYQSENYMDYMNADVDAVLYTGVTTRLPIKHYPLFDEAIPFWQLTYHGIVMSGASSQTVNYTIKGNYERLKSVEYGSRPVMYFNSKFGEDRNWMGDKDLLNKTDEQIRTSAAAVKKAYDEYEKLKHLQYEFMENHEKIGDRVFRVTYSDGTVITVDYKQSKYTVSKITR